MGSMAARGVGDHENENNSGARPIQSIQVPALELPQAMSMAGRQVDAVRATTMVIRQMVEIPR